LSNQVDRRPTPGLLLTALGIVYGDLGTSPLYTMQTVVSDAGGHVDALAARGLLSLIVWALVLIVSVKYCFFVMRADNHGEGGILALMSLVTANRPGRHWALVAAGLFGAALLYGDGVITPSISVLSAVEGVNVVTASLKPYVMPIAVVILSALFAVQTLGTSRIGRVFGPVMALWFASIGVLGLIAVLRHPTVLAALDPLLGARFLLGHGWKGVLALGGVFLALTGAEALYADMGHVGRKPIRLAWYGLVLPSLLLAYAGQTALLETANLPAGGNPFWLLVPRWLLIPEVVLATAATIIASQAIITGAFSMTRQAMQLGWLPGLLIRQTSDREYGQIYVPLVNWMMMAVTLALTIGFRSSESLAGAYGVAVSTTMLLTTTLLFRAMVDRWGWPAPAAVLGDGLFLVIDLAFFVANAVKIAQGGWIPLLIGALLYVLMRSWRQGVDVLHMRADAEDLAPADFLRMLIDGGIPRVPGSALFLSRHTRMIPSVIVRHVRDMGALHESLAALTLEFEEVPRVAADARLEVEHVADHFWHLTAHYGFVEVPDLSALIGQAKAQGCALDLANAVIFAARDDVAASLEPRRLRQGAMPAWRRMLFAFMFRNAVRTTDRFNLPPERFVAVERLVRV
jgi:KUP system potassium uptake protein